MCIRDRNMFSPLKRRYEFFYLIGKEYNTDLIIVKNCRERKHCSHFSHNIFFIADSGSKVSRSAYINKQHNCKLSLFLKDFYIWMIKAGSHIPVNTSDIVTILVFPYFTECYTTAFKSTVIFTGKNMPAQPSGLYFNSPD